MAMMGTDTHYQQAHQQVAAELLWGLQLHATINPPSLLITARMLSCFRKNSKKVFSPRRWRLTDDLSAGTG